ncbi:Hypothetical protein A7982_01513 [Minicystis rosea]|nr:Hypothetical protein A7982_01513 [Minicystis rosea]
MIARPAAWSRSSTRHSIPSSIARRRATMIADGEGPRSSAR